MGDSCRLASRGLRHAFAASDKGGHHLQATGNLRAVQILLGHTKIEATVRYLGVEVEDALALAEGRRSERGWRALPTPGMLAGSLARWLALGALAPFLTFSR